MSNLIYLIGPILFIGIFIMIFICSSKANNNYKNQANLTLTKKMVGKKTADNIAAGVLFFVSFMFAGAVVIMHLAAKPDSMKKEDLKVFNILFYSFAGVSIIIFIAFIFAIKSLIRTRSAINNNEFIVFVDVLGDKEEDTSTDSDGHTSTEYYFYFNQLFRNLKKKISVSYGEYKHANIGDEFYIVYVIPTKKAVAYKVGKYQLDYDLRSKLVENPNFEEYIQDKNNNDYANEYNVPIDEKALLEKYKVYNSTNLNLVLASVLIFVTIIFIGFLIARSYGGAMFIAVFVVVTFICLEENYKKNLKAKNAINQGKYNIISAIVTEDITNNHISEADKYLYFKVKDSDLEIKCLAKDFSRVNVGDEIYLCYFHQGVFINTGKPFAVINPNKEHLAQNIQSKLIIY
ncbi:hypothetical protein [Eubacterium sp.]|uniref:hypothetical protein n=1 Tax=Eubacterium sp. TaxID=142586 RepID=UPI0025E3BFFC|nr:hypothetical protein [Eubacterium sp.]MCR5628351.1 hypothetical protein [Eubacterium sp.]